MPNEEDTLAHPEQPRVLLGPWLWAVALFVFFGALVAIAFAAMSRGPSYEEGRARTRMEKLKTAHEEWNKAENSYGWVDQGKGVVHIPIARAMTLEMQELQGKQVMPAGPIATAPPETPPTSATGAAQPSAPPAAAPTPVASPGEKLGESVGKQRGPAAATNPANVPPNTQPGANATPAARPNAETQIPPVTPSVTPVQHAPGTPLPVRGASPSPRGGKP